ncbi:ABC transporter related [Desulfitobacterium hafniense DCB-2]|uniref:Nickel import system ATP-binding protein NikD n=1 Tax=Desulfitobacterium hafniense (strain DSM 10664 / DCB-2) TaxID=272564 RepID=B8G213_DESHD|nr:ABC transporter ATP-binding protein [Desulfitobacterium hafniense]ACL19331.1 ABC transporter related [Desulfitobacterium hafniense DCB-2]
MSLLEVNNLSVKFRMYEKGLRQRELEVITHLDVTIHKGEILAVVGSSGSGKSLLAHAILGILPANATMAGTLKYEGEPLTPQRQKKLRGHEIALVPQSVSYLDPLMRVAKQVRGEQGTQEQQRKAFERFALQEEVGQKFPFQLSGGMARRVLVATAVLGDAKLIIADEPTPGLNPEIAEETMRIFRELADQGCGVMLITHDIDLALKYADRIAVFYAGTTVEVTPVENFLGGEEALRHPYSRALWQALPQNGFHPIAGSQPYAGSILTGCRFAPRCAQISRECAGEVPMRRVGDCEVRCVHAS